MSNESTQIITLDIRPDVAVAGEYLSGSSYTGPHLHKILSALCEANPGIDITENSTIVNVMDYGAVGEGNLYLRGDMMKTLDMLVNEVYGPGEVEKLSADELHQAKWDVSESDYAYHTDDTDAIQRAINAVAAKRGGVVYFPKLPSA